MNKLQNARNSDNNTHALTAWVVGLRRLIVIVMLAVICLVPHVSAATAAMSNDMNMIEPDPVVSYSPNRALSSTAGWTVTADSSQVGYSASNAVDGNTTTMWHTSFGVSPAKYPHYIMIDTHKLQPMSGLAYVPRQDKLLNGTIGQYAISASSNGTAWGTPLASGTWAYDHSRKITTFASVNARYIRLTAYTEGGNAGPWASAAEIGIYNDPAMGPALPRTGWTATASSQENATTFAASNVLNGNATNMWHTQFSTGVANFPHSITLDMRQPQTTTGLSYLPRQDSMLNGTIGNYSVSVSTDGITWQQTTSGTWLDSHATKYATFSPVSARYVRLTALSEAGNRGNWTSAAEIYVHGTAPAIGVGGAWSQTIGFPEIPVSAVALPNNKLLTFSATSTMGFSTAMSATTKVAIYDLTTGKVITPPDVNTNHQMFCEGLSLLADGRLLITGGSSDSATTIYDPIANTWTAGPKLNTSRAYESTTMLSTGQVFTLGGSWDNSKGGKNGELFTPSGTTGTWTSLPNVLASAALTQDPGGIFRADNHMWLFGSANGSVFQAGPSKQMNWITTSGSGTITSAGNRADSADAMNGNAVMYDANKLVTLGGATTYADATPTINSQATRSAYTIDISNGVGKAVAVGKTGDMSYQRTFSNSVVLPSGAVLTFGGQQHPEAFTDTASVLSPELWNPSTGQFSLMRPSPTPRNYHSVAVLLQDGRVFSGGGGLCGQGCNANHADGQIFTPPYLLNADGSSRSRPSLTSTPASARIGSTISVNSDAGGANFALVRMGSTTHSIDTDQRRVPLISTISANVGTYTLRIPTDSGVVLPGNYYLFALNAQGTPSLAQVINIR